jgi:membrane fusion protein, heavy metal efflux system
MNRILISFCLVLALSACHPHEHEGDHDHGEAEAPEDGDHGHGHGGGLRYTHFTPLTELFVEFDPFVVGQESAFAAHLTHLATFKAVSDGRLTVVLTGDGDEDRVEADVSDTPGIFRPVLTPRRAGQHRLALRWSGPAGESVHDLGEVTVHATAQAAKAAGVTPDASGFSFTKEQQWPMDFATEPVVERDLRESVPATLAVRARPDAEALLTSPLEGVLRAPATGWPTVGQAVRRGQVLLHVVPRLGGGSDVAELQLEVTRRQADADRAVRERERLQGLFQVGAVPEKRLLDAQAEEKVANAALRAALTRLDGYSGGATGVPIRSPIDGIVLRVPSESGAALSAGQPLVHVANPERLWVEARVTEADAPKLATPAGILLMPAAGEPRSLDVGRDVRLVGSGGAIDPATRTLPVIVEAAAPAVGLPIGTFLPGRVYTGKSQRALALPASAVTDDAGVPVVFVQLEGESFERRPVEVSYRDGAWVSVVAGVAAGERVVTRGVPQVRLASTGSAEIGHGHAH